MPYAYSLSHQRQLAATMLLALGAGAGFWLFDSIVDHFLFSKGDWEESWLPDDAMEVWMRFLLMLFVTTFVFYSRYTSLKHLRRLASMDRRIRLISRAMEQSEDAAVIFNSNGDIEYLNPAFRKLSGIGKASVEEMRQSLLYPLAWYRSLRIQLQQACKSGQAWQGRMEFAGSEGDRTPVMANLSPVGDGAGCEHFIVTLHNIGEYERLQMHLNEIQKMEAVGVLASGMAHDFNNLFAGIHGNSYLVIQDVDENSEAGKRVEGIMELCDKGAGMIQQLLTFARKDHVRFETLDTTQLLREVYELAHSMLPSNVRLALSLPDKPMYVRMDGRQLQLALLNMLFNARDAVEEEPLAHIELSLASCVEGDSLLRHHGLDGRYVCLSVDDNGMGIGRGDEERLFEPFFTTKEVGKGTGLGLAMVYGAAQRHEGVVGCERKEKGSRFYMLLPAAGDDGPQMEYGT